MGLASSMIVNLEFYDVALQFNDRSFRNNYSDLVIIRRLLNAVLVFQK